jgi:hypothetical protein
MIAREEFADEFAFAVSVACTLTTCADDPWGAV